MCMKTLQVRFNHLLKFCSTLLGDSDKLCCDSFQISLFSLFRTVHFCTDLLLLGHGDSKMRAKLKSNTKNLKQQKDHKGDRLSAAVSLSLN